MKKLTMMFRSDKDFEEMATAVRKDMIDATKASITETEDEIILVIEPGGMDE